MSIDDADRLGPKGHVYVELVREQWRAPLERGTARRAILTAALGLALVIFGVVGALRVNGESILLLGIGLVAVYTALPQLRSLRPEFEEARRIGWVEPQLDDSRVTLGEPATFSVVLHARRALTLRNATLMAEVTPWTRSVPGPVILSLPLPVSLTGGAIAAGSDWRQTVTFRIPDTAPASFYSSDDSVRWTLTLTMAFADLEPWKRSWPMMVLPIDIS